MPTAAVPPPTQGSIFKDGVNTRPAGVALVLTAGNYVGKGVIDTVQTLAHENKVVCLKTSPVNDYGTDFQKACLAPLIEAGFVRFVVGGIEVSVRRGGGGRRGRTRAVIMCKRVQAMLGRCKESVIRECDVRKWCECVQRVCGLRAVRGSSVRQ